MRKFIIWRRITTAAFAPKSNEEIELVDFAFLQADLIDKKSRFGNPNLPGRRRRYREGQEHQIHKQEHSIHTFESTRGR